MLVPCGFRSRIRCSGAQRQHRQCKIGGVLEGHLPVHRAIFLAGDDVSWTGGWADGAVTTGLNAVWGVMNQLGGKTPVDNPGPGDRFEELKPIRLP
ncbi:hypothetical protein ABH924_000450 [Arthrobacter sp. GAS37]